MRWLLTIISLFALAISVSAPAWAFDETHLKKLKALNACVGCDLSEAKLSGGHLILAFKDLNAEPKWLHPFLILNVCSGAGNQF